MNEERACQMRLLAFHDRARKTLRHFELKLGMNIREKHTQHCAFFVSIETLSFLGAEQSIFGIKIFHAPTCQGDEVVLSCNISVSSNEFADNKKPRPDEERGRASAA